MITSQYQFLGGFLLKLVIHEFFLVFFFLNLKKKKNLSWHKENNVL